MIMEIELVPGHHGFAKSLALPWRGLAAGQAVKWEVLSIAPGIAML